MILRYFDTWFEPELGLSNKAWADIKKTILKRITYQYFLMKKLN